MSRRSGELCEQGTIGISLLSRPKGARHDVKIYKFR